MSVSINDICALTDLDLELVAGQADPVEAIRWVHTSEMPDPTPWLQGGELLLTTGLRIASDDELANYVDKLADAGVAGIGFGVGFGRTTVPQQMIDRADARGVPLISVPASTPYMAISEAVSNMIAADRYDGITRAFEAQQRLTRAALGPSSEFIREMSRSLGGWIIHTDAAGDVLHAWPTEAAARMPEVLPDLIRTRESGVRSATSVVSPEATTVVHPLAVDGLPRGFVIAGFEHPIGTYERSVLGAALGLLTIEVERSRRASERLHRQRSSALRQALRDHDLSPESTRQMRSWGIAEDALRVCVVLTHDDAATKLIDEVIHALADSDGGGAVTALHSGPDTQLVIASTDDSVLTKALQHIAEIHDETFLGIGDVTTLENLRRAHRGALHAATVGRSEHRKVTEFAGLAAVHLLLRSSTPAVQRTYIEQVLGPLAADRATGKNGTLRSTLEVFLASNGRWGDAADRLQIHRHTLRTRISQVTELIGRDPDVAHSRMELWLAFLIERSFGAPGA